MENKHSVGVEDKENRKKLRLMSKGLQLFNDFLRIIDSVKI